MENTTVNILGTEYTITFENDEEVAKQMDASVGDYGGFCNAYSHKIVISTLDKLHDTEEVKEILKKENMRHEIVHAFLNESGLGYCASNTECWAKNEEMVDWFAIQSPKIFKVFQELNIL